MVTFFRKPPVTNITELKSSKKLIQKSFFNFNLRFSKIRENIQELIDKKCWKNPLYQCFYFSWIGI